MSISIEETSDSVQCVTWTIELENTKGKIIETFRLVRFLTCITYFNISCSYNEIDPVKRKYNIDICLKHMKSVLDESEGKREVLPDNYNQPCAVWLNESEKILFNKYYNQDGWRVNATVQSKPGINVIKIFVQFNSFDLGEVNELVKQLTNMYVKQSNCDTQFCFQSKKQIGGHKNILSARSPVFAAMFNHNMQEAKTGQVFIKDISLKIFKELLYYIYSGRTEYSMTEETARLIFMAADKYEITGLKKECIHFLLIDLQESNAIDLLVWADRHSVQKVKEAAINYVAKNFKTIFQSDEWEGLTQNHPDLCLAVTRQLSK